MRRTQKVMTHLMLAAFLCFAFAESRASAIRIRASEHARTITPRVDGRYDVVCIDGRIEIRLVDDVTEGRICTHIVPYDGTWTLRPKKDDSDGSFCDLNIIRLVSRSRVLKMEAHFSAPCPTDTLSTENCDARICSGRMGGKYYAFDFYDRDALRLTRLEDGVSQGYWGNETRTGPGMNRVRISTLQHVPNILQVSRDGGRTWLPVCDDDFDQVDADVACRELGSRGAESFKVPVTVPGSDVFGIDDVKCVGHEETLVDCPHVDQLNENCNAAEHVQLTCTP